MDTSGKSVLGRYIIFNLASVVEWRVITDRKKLQVNIDHVCKSAKRVRYDYAIGNLVYVDNTDIYRKLDYNKQGPHIIT